MGRPRVVAASELGPFVLREREESCAELQEQTGGLSLRPEGVRLRLARHTCRVNGGLWKTTPTHVRRTLGAVAGRRPVTA